MKILIIEPYLTGSHQQWAEGYQNRSRHEVDIIGLSGNFWKWRMHGGAISLAGQFLQSASTPDLLLATDMLDLTTFLALTRQRTSGIPTAIYFHENQLSYPWSPEDRDVVRKRDKHYGFINYSSALTADAVFFNSAYHRQSFLTELQKFLKHFPDHRNLESIEKIRAKSRVLSLGLDLSRFRQPVAPNNRTEIDDLETRSKLILWNHRWEFDKNPGEFFRALTILKQRGLDFEVAILGECFSRRPKEFVQARESLGERIVQYGYADNFAAYAGWLKCADILPVTSNQDFFGASVVEAIYCGCMPVLPERLAYPELIPEELHNQVFYQDFEQLVNRLEEILQNQDKMNTKDLQQAMKKYSWEEVVPDYDECFVKLGEGGKE